MSPDPLVARQWPTLLLVEEEVLIRTAIGAYLRECGFRVIEVANADDAIAVLQEPHVAVDIVLCDVAMTSSKDGFSLAHWIRSNKIGVQVILAGSAAKAVAAAGDLCESGPTPSKPYDPQILLEQIKQTIAQIPRNQADASSERQTGQTGS
jgi:DNA-binding response OmpR family regulator